MPNDCFYEMRIHGKPENVRTLATWLNAGYRNVGIDEDAYIINDKNEKIPVEHHIGYRVFEAYKVSESDKDKQGNITAYISGYCAWSIASCMFDGPWSYFTNVKNEINENKSLNKLQKKQALKNRKAITIVDACKKLNVDVEIFSNESGMCFAEHYYINSKGVKEIDDCVDFEEICIEECSSYEQFVKDNPTANVSKDYYDSSECFIGVCDHLDENGMYKWQYVY